jgi:hypothetical protein
LQRCSGATLKTAAVQRSGLQRRNSAPTGRRVAAQPPWAPARCNGPRCAVPTIVATQRIIAHYRRSNKAARGIIGICSGASPFGLTPFERRLSRHRRSSACARTRVRAGGVSAEAECGGGAGVHRRGEGRGGSRACARRARFVRAEGTTRARTLRQAQKRARTHRRL